MTIDGFRGVAGTTGIITATTGDKRADKITVGPDYQDQEPLHRANLSHSSASVCRRDAAFSASMLFCATTTISRPFSLFLFRLKLSRINLFTLFLWTAVVIRFADIARPSRANLMSLFLVSTRNFLSACRRAVLKTSWKSEGLVSLYFSGNRSVLSDTLETKLRAAFSLWLVLP